MTVSKRTYRTFPFNPSPAMYQKIIDKISRTETAIFNDVFALGSVQDDARPKVVLIKGLRLMMSPDEEVGTDVARIGRSYVKAVGDILESGQAEAMARLIGETDRESGNLVKQMLLHAIDNLEIAMSGRGKVKSL